MLKITQTLSKLFSLVAVLFTLFLVAGYFSFKLMIVHPEDIEIYNQLWMILVVLALFILLLIYFAIKSVKNKLLEDVEHFQDYIEEVSNKNYQAVVKIKYFHEFLEMSLHLKNVVKRLNNKDSKKK